MIFSFAAFAALCALIVPASYINFKHQVKLHREPIRVLKEDPALKVKGINLPGYNH
jgi:hypothetical protein